MKAMVYRGPYKVRVEEKDVPGIETGVRSEFTRHGLSSRTGQKRADLSHQWLDPLVVAGPWVLAGGAAVAAGRALLRRVR